MRGWATIVVSSALLAQLIRPGPPAPQAGSLPPPYPVSRATSTIRVDGILDEFDWLVAQRIRFEKFRHEPEDGLLLREPTQAAAVWDDTHLYLAFVVQDLEVWATQRQRDGRLFPEECIEFFIDPDGTGQRYVETQINSLGNIRDLLVDRTMAQSADDAADLRGRWNYRALRHGIRIHTTGGGRHKGWILEVAIPWSDLSFSGRSWPPKPGDELRINLYRYERARHGPQPLELSGWSFVPGTFHNPERFGRFVFR